MDIVIAGVGFAIVLALYFIANELCRLNHNFTLHAKHLERLEWIEHHLRKLK